MTTCEILTIKIMNLWEKCAFYNMKYDSIINDVLEKCVLELGEVYDPMDLTLTVYQMTNAHKRVLYDKMKQTVEQLSFD